MNIRFVFELAASKRIDHIDNSGWLGNHSIEIRSRNVFQLQFARPTTLTLIAFAPAIVVGLNILSTARKPHPHPPHPLNPIKRGRGGVDFD